ncbi:MAG: fluoride efflux transporter CrcB, partial [Plesiomonas sp.]
CRYRILTWGNRPVFSSLLAVSGGAAIGASLRWWIGTKLNHLMPHLPPGTLLVNLLGGFLIGLAIEIFLRTPHVSPHLRLFIITGFLGGLTTFSSFSAEMIASLEKGQTLWVFGGIILHLGGSLLMTFAGMSLVRYFWP